MPDGNTPAQYVPRALVIAVRVLCSASESIVTFTAASALPFDVTRPTIALDIDCAGADVATEIAHNAAAIRCVILRANRYHDPCKKKWRDAEASRHPTGTSGCERLETDSERKP